MHPDPPHLPLTLVMLPHKEKNLAVEAAVCHGVSHCKAFSQTALLANDHYNGLVWPEASGLCYTINTGSSLRLFLGVLLCHRDPAA